MYTTAWLITAPPYMFRFHVWLTKATFLLPRVPLSAQKSCLSSPAWLPAAQLLIKPIRRYLGRDPSS